VIAARGITLTGDDLREVVSLRGSVNRRPVTVGDVQYDAETLVFRGFSGVKDNDACHGEYRFRLAQPGDDERDLIDFAALPSWPAAVIVLP
jgi:hypothetical protein